MNRLEFQTILKVLNIQNIVKGGSNRYGTTEEVYDYNGVRFYFDGMDKVVVKGNLPMTVISSIKTKYSKDMFKNLDMFSNTHYISDKKELIILITELQDYFLNILTGSNRQLQTIKQSVFLKMVEESLNENDEGMFVKRINLTNR